MVKALQSAWPIVLGMLMLAGCQNVPGADGRYATPARGGWDNFRAEAPPSDQESPAVGGRENFRADATPTNDPGQSPGM